VPTAPVSPSANPPRPLRHIGQPLGRLEDPDFSSMIEAEALPWQSAQ
jgi:hypothetical protein